MRPIGLELMNVSDNVRDEIESFVQLKNDWLHS